MAGKSIIRPTVNWHTKALVSLWILQFIVFILVIIFLAIALAAYNHNNHDYGSSNGLIIGELAFFSICMLLMLAEIIAYANHRLNVWLFFSSQLFKCFFWTVVLVITSIDLAWLNGNYGHYSSSGYAYTGVSAIVIIYLIATTIIVYAALGYSCAKVDEYRKARKTARQGPIYGA